MKITLAMAPWDLWQDEEDTLYPMGLAYLGSVLEKNNHEVDLLNLTNTQWEEVKPRVFEKIKKEKPDFFGISILSNSRISALKLLKVVKEASPETKIIAGGVHTSFLHEQVLDKYPVDYAVIGEGEITFIELIEAIKKEKSLEYFKKIKGIAFKHKYEIIKTEPRERIRDLDSLPFPKHEFFEKTIKKHKTAYMMTSRGCPFSCSFCPSSAFLGVCLIQRSAENVFEEIKYLIKKFPYLEEIHFLDDEFVCNNKRIIDLCKMMLKENIKIKWNCLGRASSINEELISWMKKAGCYEVIFGVESGSQRMLDGMGKRVKVEQIINAFEICKKYKLETACLMIVGLPGENKESVNESIALAKKLKKVISPAILIVYPGTRVYEVAKEKGMMTDDYWLAEGLPPLYTAEHSKSKLLWWSFKSGLISRFYAENGDFIPFIKEKFIKKLHPHNFIRITKRYLSDKT